MFDRMTEWIVDKPLQSFESGVQPVPWTTVALLEQGKNALQAINSEMGLALDDWDQEYYFNLFTNTLHRNPTTVELFDISQSNSEHSRHWFFKGKIVIDGEEQPEQLMQVVSATLLAQPHNSVIAFSDNSSVIKGFDSACLLPCSPGKPSQFELRCRTRHLLLTAETHNFPSGVAPFPGAETGTGGRIRDTHATGRGSLVVAGIAGYCVGNLHISHHSLPWEDSTFVYPSNLAKPLQIEINASNGASDYGNKFGEPVVCGFTRSFGMRLADGSRREWVKPIMFSAGMGLIDQQHIRKGAPLPSMVCMPYSNSCEV